MNLFEQLVIWLIRNKQTVTVTTGLMYGHKIIKLGRYQITELDENMVTVSADDLYLKISDIKTLIEVIEGIK